jgi:hypothetical protein
VWGVRVLSLNICLLTINDWYIGNLFETYHLCDFLRSIGHIILKILKSSIMVGMATTLLSRWFGLWIRKVAINFSVFLNVQNSCGAHPASCSKDIGVLSLEQSSWDVKLTAHFHLVSRLRMKGAVPLQSLNLHDVGWGKFYFLYVQTSLTSLNKYT